MNQCNGEETMDNLTNYIISEGIPVYNGLCQGKAIVVKSSIDFIKVQNRSKKIILIVNNFDPSYDILLDKCIGVASELGNILCHLAIVSRIRKIPAIVNAKNITLNIKDGDYITIDAYKGILYRGRHSNSLTSEDEINIIKKFYSKLNNDDS
jgi:pyruvate,water dikinase